MTKIFKLVKEIFVDRYTDIENQNRELGNCSKKIENTIMLTKKDEMNVTDNVGKFQSFIDSSNLFTIRIIY